MNLTSGSFRSGLTRSVACLCPARLGTLQLLAFAFVISACAAASNSDSKSYNFAAIWLMLLTIGFSVGGTLVMRKVGDSRVAC